MTSGKEKSNTLSILRKGYDKGIIGYNKGNTYRKNILKV